VVVALMDETLRGALGLPRQPAWIGRAARAGLRLRALALRFAPPRSEPKPYPATTYPDGHTLADLGPTSMLASMNAAPSPLPPQL
jgi:hypothetical protein